MPRLEDIRGRSLRVGHFTSIDASLTLLLATELRLDFAAGADVFAISAAGASTEELRSMGVTPVAVPHLTRTWDLRQDLRAARSLYRLLKELQLDVLHTHMPKAGVLGRIVGRAAGVPVIVNTCHGLWVRPEDPRLLRWAVLLAEGFAAQCSDFELYQNGEDASTMRWAVSRKRSKVVGNGVDLARFTFDPAARRRVRSEWGVADDDVVVGAVGRIIESKGVRVFCDMAERLHGKAHFVWIGPTDEEHVDTIVPKSTGVNFIGMRSDMEAVLSALDIFVHPSFAREGLSRASMEAGATGRAIVITDVRGCREIGRPFEEVLLVRPRSVDELTAAVALLISDPFLRRRLGDAALARARQSFNQHCVALTSVRTYQDVARRKDLRWCVQPS